MSENIKSPLRAVDRIREDVKQKMIELAIRKAHESELNALYYEEISGKEKTKESKAQFAVHVDALRETAKQQRELADFLIRCTE